MDRNMADKNAVAADDPLPQTTADDIPPTVPRPKFCALPMTASQAVRRTYGLARGIVALNVISLIAFDYISPVTWISCLLFGVITGCMLMYKYTKRCYTAAAVLFMLGCICSLVQLLLWEVHGRPVLEGDDADTFEIPILTIYMGALYFLVGSICAFIAVCNWGRNGDAPNTSPV